MKEAAYLIQCLPPGTDPDPKPQFFLVHDDPVQARRSAEHWLRTNPLGRARIGRVEWELDLISAVHIEERK